MTIGTTQFLKNSAKSSPNICTNIDQFVTE